MSDRMGDQVPLRDADAAYREGMDTTRTGMRTVLATVAAAALIMGSAAGAMAAPTERKTVPDAKIHSVTIHGHSPVNVFSVDTARAIKVRATVRYAKGVSLPTTPPTGTATLAAFSKKVDGTPIVLTLPATSPITTDLMFRSKTKKDLRFANNTVAPFKLTTAQVTALQGAVATATADKTKVYLCLSDATFSPDIAATSKQVYKRLDAKRPVRDCVKVINVDPTTLDNS